MNKYLLLLPLVLNLTACSLFDTFEEPPLSEQTLENLRPINLRLMANEGMDVSHDEVMDKYQQYLQVSDDAEMKVRALHRIANLRLQKDEFLWEGGEDSDEAREFIANAELGRASIDAYEQLLEEFPDRNDNDVAMYQLAKAYSLAGEPFEAVRVLEQLTELYPRSDYYLEALFRSGEIYYANDVYDKAEQAYQRLVDRGEEENKFFISAMYLKGWSLFKQTRYDDALMAFTQVLDYEFPDESRLLSADPGQKNMLEDILRVMAITFDYQGDWETIAAFYDKAGPRHYEYLLYDKLASQYYDKKYFKSGASTLRAFIQRNPDDVLAPVFYQRVIEGYTKAGYPTLLRKHKRIYIKKYGIGGDYWNKHGFAVQASIKPQLKTYIWDLARFNHAWGQRLKKSKERRETLQKAIDWYAEYIRSFPQADDTAKAHFLLAEVAYQTKQYPLAKDHYEIVAYQYPQYEKASESGYAAIITYSKHKPGKKDKAVWRQLTVASAMRFVQEFPTDERRGKVLVNTAEMMLTDKYYQQALDTALLAWQSEGSLSERHRYGAALVRSHSSFELEKFADAEVAINEALVYSKIKKDVKQDLREKLAASIYKQGEAAKAAGDHETAVAQWLRVGKVVPESDIKVSAEFDAATILMAEEKYDQAVPVLLDFRSKYPKHHLVRDIPSKLIIAYESAENWQGAADELKRIWELSDNKEEKRIALFQSAEYYEKAGKPETALTTYKRYAHDYKRPFDPAVEAHYKLDQIYTELGEDTKRLFWLNKLVWLHLGAKKDQTERSKFLAARAAYELGEVERSKYDRVKIKLPLAKSIEKKNKHMQHALERYKQAIQIGVLEYTTSATFRIAALYHGFSKGLMASERPAGMDELELEEYEYLLEDQAFPLEEAAIEVHQTNAGRTYDGLYDEWVKKSYKSLADLMPAQYAKFEKPVSYVEAIR